MGSSQSEQVIEEDNEQEDDDERDDNDASCIRELRVAKHIN